MKNKILALGLVLALVAVMVMPMAVSAGGATTTPVTISGDLTATATPGINTPTQIYAGATSISGTAVADATITLTVSGNVQTPPTTTATGGVWTVGSLVALQVGDVIHVTAELAPNGPSAEATATVIAHFATLTAPASFTWDTTFGVGNNKGHATTAGSVVSGGDPWTLSVVDPKTNNNGYMTVGGADSSGATKLVDPIQVDTSTIGSTIPADTISHYSGTAIPLLTNYGTSPFQGQSSCTIPLYAFQIVAGNATVGSYSLTLNYVLSPSY